jgi:hypothetical protein
MIQFSTPVEITPLPWQTGYRHKNMLIGSCFTENIGEKMKNLFYSTDINPFGILYNPVSIARCLRRMTNKRKFASEDLFIHDGIWHSYQHHGRFSDENHDKALDLINNRLLQSAAYLREAQFLFITLGTALIYELKATGEIIANCHKMPSDIFRRFRLTVTETVETLQEALDELFASNPGIRVIFTVSPIRHLKDGASGNQLSKATLLLAVDALVRGFGQDRCAYFPSYEIVMDELRDYRFYADDMTHLSSVATQYIWNRFEEIIIDKESREISRQIAPIIKAMEHRPFNRNTPMHQAFLAKTLKKVHELSDNYPYIQLLAAKEHFEKEIQKFTS